MRGHVTPNIKRAQSLKANNIFTHKHSTKKKVIENYYFYRYKFNRLKKPKKLGKHHLQARVSSYQDACYLDPIKFLAWTRAPTPHGLGHAPQGQLVLT